MNLFLGVLLALLMAFACFHPRNTAAEENDSALLGGQGRELIMRGEYEKGLDQLRQAYLLFPLNEVYRRNLAEGYAAYGHHLFRQNRHEQADEQFLKAMELYPEEVSYSLLRGICNYHLKKYDVARYELERTRQKRPEALEVLYYLGLVLYESDRRQQAVELWQHALERFPGRRELEDVLKKARREMSVEAGMDRGHSSRFDLTYDAGVDAAFALSVLDVLERAAGEIGAELGYFPSARVPVAIYTRGDFKTVTESPDWSGGVYDGTIRLPFGAFHEITPQLRGVLHHEYAHVVVFEMTRGNCPTWLNEGIAEMFGRIQHNRPLGELGRSARKHAYMDFRKMESGFTGLSASEAALAYQQSYAMVNFLATTYGWHRISETLRLLGEGFPIDTALTRAYADYSLSYDDLVREWKGYMAAGLGNRND